jgi:hypothetical protein
MKEVKEYKITRQKPNMEYPIIRLPSDFSK